MSEWRVIQGDCAEVMRTLERGSLQAMVTDPPAGISFMGKDWDCFRRRHNPADVGGRESVFGRTSAHAPHSYGESDRGRFIAAMQLIFAECLRVLTPGAHALVWALPRTSHWTATALEDAGFEIRDVVTHHQSTGFPKSLNISKALDKARRRDYVAAALDLGLSIPGNSLHDWTKAEHSPGDGWWEHFKATIPKEDWCRIEREIVGRGNAGLGQGKLHQRVIGNGGFGFSAEYEITSPATSEAQQWAGFGTALKPASEHWILCRVPLSEGTVAANVLKYGTGALNIDGARVPLNGEVIRTIQGGKDGGGYDVGSSNGTRQDEFVNSKGRWPANLILSHSPDCNGTCAPGCPVAEMDRQSGESSSTRLNCTQRARGDQSAKGAERELVRAGEGYDDEGCASRFFYTSKPSKTEQERGLEGRNSHPTVKPVELMRYLIRLITPPGGTVLDPFTGSGSTGVAAVLEGMDFLGIEQETEYCEMARRRIAHHALAPESGGTSATWSPPSGKHGQMTLTLEVP